MEHPYYKAGSTACPKGIEPNYKNPHPHCETCSMNENKNCPYLMEDWNKDVWNHERWFP